MSGPAASVSIDAPRAATVRPRPGPFAWIALSVTIVAALLQIAPLPKATTIERSASLQDLFPSSVHGWTGKDLPLAQTEAAASQAEKILHFDEYLFRSYQKQGVEFSVYVAYWSPGRIAAREVAFHIPDKCWTSAGYKRTHAEYDRRIEVSGKTYAPAQYREFSSRGSDQNVLYWHIFNGAPIVYNRDGSPSDLSMLTDLFRLGLALKGEQYFIRVNSAVPFEELMRDEGFVQVMELVGELGPGRSTALTEY